MTTGSVTITINRPVEEVWAAVTDITRMGDWSPECIAGRWVDGATGPAMGARFEGDNEAKIAGRTVKAWTTTSEVIACEPGASFAFDVGGVTTWRYTFAAESPDNPHATTVTESFEYLPKGVQGFIYEYVYRRSRTMRKGMQRTLDRMKATLEQ